MKIYGITKCSSCNRLLLYKHGDIWKDIDLEVLSAENIDKVPAAICPCGEFVFPLLPVINKGIRRVVEKFKEHRRRKAARNLINAMLSEIQFQEEMHNEE